MYGLRNLLPLDRLGAVDQPGYRIHGGLAGAVGAGIY